MGSYFEKDRGAWRYDFQFKGQRHRAPRGWPTKKACEEAEAEQLKRLRRAAAGLEPLERPLSPRFAEIAGSYLAFVKDRAESGGAERDVDTIERNLRVILRFFGTPQEKFPGEPYHDLRLQAVIDDASWILRFEEWMSARGIKGSTRNRYRSACSRLYWFAMLPQYRARTGITVNPFRGLLRDEEQGRTVTLSVKQLRAIVNAAEDWLAIAIAIGTFAPKLRLGNILGLRWDRDIDEAMTQFTIAKHKTRHRTGRPLVAPITGPLRQILTHLKADATSPWVILRRSKRCPQGRPVKRRNHVCEALEAACQAAGVVYGRQQEIGATFHTIRHSAATQLAALGIEEGLRKNVMGHLCIQTTQKYTHLQPEHERRPLELLSKAMPVATKLLRATQHNQPQQGD